MKHIQLTLVRKTSNPLGVINSQVIQSEIIINMAKMILQFFKTTQNPEVFHATFKRSEDL
jgi:hypothetical protein